MNALKNAVLHLLHAQTQSDNPALAQVAKRHHEAVSAEEVWAPAELDKIAIDPDELERTIAEMKRNLPKLKDDLPNGLAEWPKPVPEVPFTDGRVMLAARIPTTLFPTQSK